MFNFKMERLSLIDLARANHKSYPKRLLLKLIKKLDKDIKASSYEGARGTYLDLNNIDREIIDRLKEHYESQGFKTEMENETFWVWWGK